MSLYLDRALSAFIGKKNEMVTFQNQQLTETDSRSKIIDPLLKDVFQWEEKSITREPHIQAGYIDYFCKSEFNSFVLEAKSTKIDFKIPSNNKINFTSVKKIEKSSKPLYDAIEQARNYAQQKGTPFFVVSNGLHLTISKTFLSNEEDYDLMIFNGENCIEENIHILINILSPYKEGASYFLKCIEVGFELRNLPQFSRTLLQDAHYNSTSHKGSNVLAQPLSEILGDYFEDINEDGMLLDNIYCNTSDLDGYSKEMRNFLKGRVSMLGLPIEEVRQIETSDESSTALGNDMAIRRQNKKKGHLFILFGNLGAGKTTFLSRYYHYILNELQRKKLLWVLVDFQTFYGSLEDIDIFIIEKIEEHIYKTEKSIIKFEVLKELYSDEIERKVEGAWAPYSNSPDQLNRKIGDFIEERQGNKKEHIEKCLRYLKEKYEYEICLVFDNLDQHSDSLQEKVSLYAVTRTKELGALAIVSMRDETYWNLRKRPPLNAYGNITSYQVVSPSMEQVLLRRLDFVLSVMGEKVITFDSSPSMKMNAAISTDYKSIFSLFKDTIQTDGAKNILNNLSSGDVRKGLNMFKSLVTSGHIDLVNILTYPMDTNDNKRSIPDDKILKAIGLADQMFFDSKKSIVLNLFRSNKIDGFYSHFINYRILEVLESNLQSRPVLDGPAGFMEIDELFKQLNIYCANKEKMRELLIPFLERFLIESDIGARRLRDADYYNNINYVRITPSGLYHKDTIMYDFQYLEMVMMDTPIHDQETYDKLLKENKLIRDSQFVKKWEHKFNAVSIFLNYLKVKEEEEMMWIRKQGITHFGLIVPRLINQFQESKIKIELKLQQKNNKN